MTRLTRGLLSLALVGSITNVMVARDRPGWQRTSGGGGQADSAWRADMAALKAGVLARHPKPWHRVSELAYDSAVVATLPRLAGAPRGIAAAEIARIVALIGDAHTGLDLFPSARLGLGALPVRFDVASDGIIISQAAPLYRALVGRRVLAIGGISAEEAARRLIPFLPHENEMAAMARLGVSLGIPELLVAAKLASSVQRVELSTEGTNGAESVMLSRIEPLTPGPRDTVPDWGHLPPVASVNPMGTGALWSVLTSDSIHFLRIDAIANVGAQSFGDVIRDELAKVHAHDARALVMDLRFNGGGNNTLLAAAIRSIVRDTLIDRPDRLFILVGRRTASAAANFTELLRTYTKSTFVGDPTGAPPNHYGDAASVVLPASGLVVRVATVWWQFDDPRSTRTTLRPDISASFALRNLRNGTDPAMDSVRAVLRRRSSP